jgi:hypothetical protein
MKEKILAFLKTRLTGVQETYLQGVAELYSKTITDEAAIETTFTDGVISGLKFSAEMIQREGDRRATSAVQTYEKNHNLKDGKAQGVDTTKPTNEPNSKLPDDAPTWAKDIFAGMQKQNQELAQRLNQFESNGQQNVLLGKLKTILKDKVPESFLKGRAIQIDNEAQINEVAQQLEADYSEFHQELVTKGVAIDVPKTPQPQGKKAIESEIADLAKKF